MRSDFGPVSARCGVGIDLIDVAPFIPGRHGGDSNCEHSETGRLGSLAQGGPGRGLNNTGKFMSGHFLFSLFSFIFNFTIRFSSSSFFFFFFYSSGSKGGGQKGQLPPPPINQGTQSLPC